MVLVLSTVGQDGRVATPREHARERTMNEVVRIGRRHLAEHGAGALSLRAVARELGVVSSAVYRYVPSREALLTLLLIDAYDELGTAAENAEAAVPHHDVPARWRALAGAVRTWALAEPARYGLLFGAPVPGYAAPAEQTTTPGSRVIALVLALVADAEAGGAAMPEMVRVPASLAADFSRVREQTGTPVSDRMLVVAVAAWTVLFGAVSFEVFGQYGRGTFTEPAQLFDAVIDLIATMIETAH